MCDKDIFKIPARCSNLDQTYGLYRCANTAILHSFCGGTLGHALLLCSVLLQIDKCEDNARTEADLWKDHIFAKKVKRFLCVTRVFPLDGVSISLIVTRNLESLGLILIFCLYIGSYMISIYDNVFYLYIFSMPLLTHREVRVSFMIRLMTTYSL